MVIITHLMKVPLENRHQPSDLPHARQEDKNRACLVGMVALDSRKVFLILEGKAAKHTY